MNHQDRVATLALDAMQDPSHYLVEVKVRHAGRQAQVRVLVDGDQGIRIDECAEISRRLAEALEAENVFADAYVLEVSSPGVDHPLSTERQFRKNLGRTLKIQRPDGTEAKGELVSVDAEGITLAPEALPKGKKNPAKAKAHKAKAPKKGGLAEDDEQLIVDSGQLKADSPPIHQPNSEAPQPRRFPYSDIKKATVEISFK